MCEFLENDGDFGAVVGKFCGILWTFSRQVLADFVGFFVGIFLWILWGNGWNLLGILSRFCRDFVGILRDFLGDLWEFLWEFEGILWKF